MDEATRSALRDLNRRFYEERGEAFSATRGSPWPGWQRVAPHLEQLARTHAPLRVLDVGCGNGRFADFLADHFRDLGRRIEYVGVDASRTLLDIALRRPLERIAPRWHRADFVDDADALPPDRFHAVALFGVLHEVPDRALRRMLLARLVSRVARGGLLVVTRWRFGELPRFARRTLPFETWNAGAAPRIDPSRVEPGDALLPWQLSAERAGEAPLPGHVRYAHALDELEFAALVHGLPLTRVEVFREDGRERDLNEYSIFRHI